MMATVVVGTLAFAALGGIDVLGFGTEAQSAPVEIVETSPTTTAANDVTISVDTTTTLVGEQPATSINPDGTPMESSGVTNGGGAAPIATTPRATTPGAPATTAGTTPATTPAATAAPTPSTAAPTTVTVPRTTTPPVTTAAPPASTLPAGVPKDWPPGKPIPPKPAGCIDGQLEDNGVWNCQN